VQAAEGSGWVDGAYLQAAGAGAMPMTIRWYGHDFDGGVLACGGVYNADDPGVAATNGFPCGTHLKVCATGRCVTVVVRDRGHMGPGAMDLSAAAFQRLSSLDAGVLIGTVQPTSDDPAPPPPPPPPAPPAGH
jgi:rare lipoprotein A (peptidoglycan hydrolase)